MTLLETLQTMRLPDLLTDRAGQRVHTRDHWRRRRRELLDVLAREEYGRTPPPVPTRGEVLELSLIHICPAAPASAPRRCADGRRCPE